MWRRKGVRRVIMRRRKGMRRVIMWRCLSERRPSCRTNRYAGSRGGPYEVAPPQSAFLIVNHRRTPVRGSGV